VVFERASYTLDEHGKQTTPNPLTAKRPKAIHYKAELGTSLEISPCFMLAI
jgi:hypothetical protein